MSQTTNEPGFDTGHTCGLAGPQAASGIEVDMAQQRKRPPQRGGAR